MNSPSRTSLDELCRAIPNRNLSPARLVEQALLRGEARLSADGALVADTGAHTGRSPKDKCIVRDRHTEDAVWWDNSHALQPAQFDVLLADLVAHLDPRESYVQDLAAGAEPAHRIAVRVVTELAWHALFIRNLLLRPDGPIASRTQADLTIVDCPSFKADPIRHGSRSETIIACDFTQGIVLIVGTAYAGEIKKSVFSYLNYVLPARSVLPMHCSANVGAAGDTAIFFGLSGTGKTTLSTDPSRRLVGDDEHGWDASGIFNFEGGCYAKATDLSPRSEPEIFVTTRRFATVMENVTLDPESRTPDFADRSRTENTRVAYPIDAIPAAVPEGRAGQPTAIILLTCDAFGVLPPVARLTPDQAVYHFLSGYTAKVAGTERGVREPEATFSACFGAPFMSRHPAVYGEMFREVIERHAVPCWMLNTGWSGGGYGVGSRMPLAVTRRLLSAALDGSLAAGGLRTDSVFGFAVPVHVDGLSDDILDPIATWADPSAYTRAADRLVAMFAANFDRFTRHVSPSIRSAGPFVSEPV
jgi:phosphoenolpyruvate carboxykinase (ATP)